MRSPDASSLSFLFLSLRRRRFIHTYFTQLDAEYEYLCDDAYKQKVHDEVEALRKASAARPSWHLNHQFEYLVLKGLPDAVIEQRAGIYRQRLLDLSGAASDSPLGQAFAMPQSDPDKTRLMLLGALSEVQRLRHVRSEFERLRNRLFAVCVSIGFSFILFHALNASAASSSPSSLLTKASTHVCVAGVLGGYFSVLIRLGGMRWCPDYNLNYQQVDRLFWNILVSFFLSLFEGAVAAYLLYTLFLSGILQGAMFPTFEGAASSASIVEVLGVFPPKAADTAKLLVWCVIAGFSERLIPDMLTALGSQAASSVQKQGA